MRKTAKNTDYEEYRKLCGRQCTDGTCLIGEGVVDNMCDSYIWWGNCHIWQRNKCGRMKRWERIHKND